MTSDVRGQNADEVMRLKERIELLKAKLKLAEKENALLRRELEQYKAQKADVAKGDTKKSLSDMLSEGKVLAGLFRYTNKDLLTGDITVTISEREGKKMKGSMTLKHNVKDSAPVAREIEGEIDGARLSFKTVGSESQKISMSTSLKGEILEGSWVNSVSGSKGTVGLKLTK